MRLIPIAVVTAAIPLLVSGCSGDGLASDDSYSVAGALGEIPEAAADDSPFVATADLVQAEEYAGLTRPDSAADTEEVTDWAQGLTDSATVFVPGPELLQYSVGWGAMEEELGWSGLEVDSFVSAGPLNVAVADDASLDGDLPESDGITRSGSGELGSPDVDHMDQPAFPFPVVTGMVLDGDRLGWSTDEESLTAWTAADGDTLADDEDLAAVAAALDDHDVYAAALTSDAVSPPSAPDQSATPDFDAAGVGWAVEDDQPRLWIAWAFSTSDAAEDSVADIEALFAEGVSMQTNTPLSELISLEEIEADADVVVARVEPADGRLNLPYQMMVAGDLPFA